MYNERLFEYKHSQCNWSLGVNSVEEGDSFLHLGVVNDKNISLDQSVQEYCLKLRQTYFSLNDFGISRECMHPLSLKRIYKTVVLSKALYGSELWNCLSSTHLQNLVRAHKQYI